MVVIVVMHAMKKTKSWIRQQRSHLLEDKLVSRPRRTTPPTPPCFFFLFHYRTNFWCLQWIEGDYTPEIILKTKTDELMVNQNFRITEQNIYIEAKTWLPHCFSLYLYIIGLFSSWQLLKMRKCKYLMLLSNFSCLSFWAAYKQLGTSPHLSQITRIGKEHTGWWVILQSCCS